MRVRVRRGAGPASWWRGPDELAEDGPVAQVAEPADDDPADRAADLIATDPQDADQEDSEQAMDQDRDGSPAEEVVEDSLADLDPAPPEPSESEDAQGLTYTVPDGLPEPGAAAELRAGARRVRDEAAQDIRDLRRMARELAVQIAQRRDQAHQGARDLLAQADAIDHAWAVIDARRQLEATARQLEAEAAAAEEAARLAEATLADAARRHHALESRLAEVPGERQRHRAELSQATTEARSLAELTGIRQSLAMLDAVVADLEAERDAVVAQIQALGTELERAQERAAVTRRRADACRWQAQHDPLDEDIPPAPVATPAAADEFEPSPPRDDPEPDPAEDIVAALPVPREG